MLRKFFIKRAIKKSISDVGQVIKREVKLVQKASRDIGQSLSRVKIPVKIKAR